MSINDRVKELRKALGLNQTDFSGPLGLKQTTIAGYENGARSVSEATILAICREYGANEKWLRTGEGSMFVSGHIPASALSELAQEYDLDAVDVALVSEYLKLEKRYRDALKKKMREIFLADEEELAIQEELASYERELRAEKGEKSSASDTTNVKEA